MSKKYKIHVPAKEDDLLTQLSEMVNKSGKKIEPFDIRDYEDEPRRVEIFDSAVTVLQTTLNGLNQVVAADKDEDTTGGEISIFVNDLILDGERLNKFTRAISSASTIELVSYADGRTEIALVYRDLMTKKEGKYEN